MYGSKSLESKLIDAKSSISKLEMESKELSSLNSDIMSLMKEESNRSSPIRLEDAVSSTMLAIRNEASKNGVTIGFASPAKAMGGSFSTIDSLKEDIPDTDIASLKINVNGTYTSYGDFLVFIKEIQKLPVAVVSARVIDHDFQISFRVYGLK